MSEQVSVPDMETEVARAPEQRALAYAPLTNGVRGKLTGGGEVYLSNNVKAATKARADGKVPVTFLTSEVDRTQQSIAYRAIAAALTFEVIPVAHVSKRYANADKLDTFIASLLADDGLRAKLGIALAAHEEAILALLTGEEDEPEQDDDMEDPGE